MPLIGAGQTTGSTGGFDFFGVYVKMSNQNRQQNDTWFVYIRQNVEKNLDIVRYMRQK